MLSELGYWLYVYGYNDEAVHVCELFDDIEFTGNYDIWNQADYAFCLKIRVLREKGKSEEIKEFLVRVNDIGIRNHMRVVLSGIEKQ